MEITVDQMYRIENKGHEMGFLKKFNRVTWKARLLFDFTLNDR